MIPTYLPARSSLMSKAVVGKTLNDQRHRGVEEFVKLPQKEGLAENSY